jgi:hypothetical protein
MSSSIHTVDENPPFGCHSARYQKYTQGGVEELLAPTVQCCCR